MWIGFRRALSQLNLARRAAGTTVALFAAGTLAVSAATPSPHASAPVHGKARTLIYHFPKKALHTEFIVSVNKLGQVTHILAGKPSNDAVFNSEVYANAIGVFIRTPDGMHAVVGKYRLDYLYSPTSHKVHRTVALLSRGGVDPNAVGAVNALRARAAQMAKAHETPPTAQMPSLNTLGIPSSAPSGH